MYNSEEKATSVTIDDIELKRLQILQDYNILDTPAEREFDDLVSLAAYICDTPIALITLLTHDRQWFKARIGVSLAETPRCHSFCQYAIEQEDIMEIPDALQDIRFFQNPYVLGNPNIRFYAGSPLVNADGYKLGTLCVIDKYPRELTEPQKMALGTLANQVVAHLELRLKIRKLEAENNYLQEQVKN
ncbi:GAF domain-containing protein [Adhaeribacter rhizoryzae]|uniref:GAF domain-containing protein n=1 Tax=Adhaeribacter rhizoryzae TaxID=2607907 RepID=UPI00167FDFB5|nr:GAF domain-containing protein [Adhaeribacter rhizoryzae]